jgi:D-alanyl-lipoteichoic acid acyltransferase DltB (MBOAT superfamily)
MARGVGLVFNVKLPENFNNPLIAKGIIEFWQRWHMTLTAFITNYMYMPMVRRSKPTLSKTIPATLIAMTVAGAWHGPSWNYVIFGIWHGVGLVTNNLWRSGRRHIPAWLSWAVTMIFLIIGFVFFRAPTAASALHMLRLMFRPGLFAATGLLPALTNGGNLAAGFMLAGLGVLCFTRTAAEFAAQTRLRPQVAVVLAASAFLTLMLMNSKTSVSFIYRQF